MEDKIEQFINDVYEFPKKHSLFRRYSFNQACYITTCVFQKMVNIALLNNPSLIDRLRDSYRELLKECYKFCNKNDEKIPIINDDLKNKTAKELFRLIEFNGIRNSIDQYRIGRMNIEINDSKVLFSRINRRKDEQAMLYAKLSDFYNYDDNTSKTSGLESEYYRNILNPKTYNYYNPQDYSSKYSGYFDSLYKFAIRKQENDFVFNDKYDFGEFTSNDFKKVYAYLLAEGIMELNYQIVSQILNIESVRSNTPIIILDKNELIKRISLKTKLSNEKVSSIINELIYDPIIHADKVTILQPLLTIGNYIYYSPSHLFTSMQIEKMLYLFKERNHQLITIISKDREKIMTDDLIKFLKNSKLKIQRNFVIMNGLKPVSEIDLCIYDEVSNIVLLTELKWFMKGDGEKDHKGIDSKIEAEINKRVKKQTIAKKHIDQIKNLFNIKDDVNLHSVIVCKNYSGSDFIIDNIPVFDVSLFKHNLNVSNYNLNNFIKRIENNQIYEGTKTDNLEYENVKIDYAGYEVVIPGIKYNK